MYMPGRLYWRGLVVARAVFWMALSIHESIIRTESSRPGIGEKGAEQNDEREEKEMW